MVRPIPFPVICNNAACRTVWLSQYAGVSAWPGTTIGMKGCGTGPCPKCGGSGRIPDGEYTVFGGRLANAQDLSTITQQLQLLAHEVLAGASAEDIKKSIDSKYQRLSFLKKYLPQNPVELAAYLTLIGGTIAYCSHKTSDDAPHQVHVTVEVQQVLEQTLGDLRTSQTSTQPEKSKSKDQETPKD